jgi:hypothetical protein
MRLTWLDLGGMSVMALAQSGIHSISSFLQTCLVKKNGGAFVFG